MYLGEMEKNSNFVKALRKKFGPGFEKEDVKFHIWRKKRNHPVGLEAIGRTRESQKEWRQL